MLSEIIANADVNQKTIFLLINGITKLCGALSNCHQLWYHLFWKPPTWDKRVWANIIRFANYNCSKSEFESQRLSSEVEVVGPIQLILFCLSTPMFPSSSSSMLYLILSRLRSTELSVSFVAFKEAAVTTFLTSRRNPKPKFNHWFFVRICLNIVPSLRWKNA